MCAYRVSLFGAGSVRAIVFRFYQCFLSCNYHIWVILCCVCLSPLSLIVVLCTKIYCIVLSILVNHVSRVSWQLMMARPKKKKEIGGEGGNLRIHVFRSVIPFSDRFEIEFVMDGS